MRKIAVIFALVLGMGVFVGCGSTKSDNGTPASVDKDYVFTETVHNEYPSLPDSADDELIALAHATCTAFDNGVTFEDILNTVVSKTINPAETQAMGFIMGAGVETYCPQYSDVVDSY